MQIEKRQGSTWGGLVRNRKVQVAFGLFAAAVATYFLVIPEETVAQIEQFLLEIFTSETGEADGGVSGQDQ